MTPHRKGFLSWLVDRVSSLLDEHDRDVVCGDLAECHSRTTNALREIVGLVIRRQATLWVDWRPWLAVVSVVIPIGLLLSHASRWWGVTTAINGVHYWTLWDVAYLAYPGWRADLTRIVVGTCIAFVALVGWSWTTGFVLGRLSRRTVWTTMTLLCLVVLTGTLGTITTAQARAATPTLQYHVVFVVFPRLLRTFLVMLPAVWGAYRGVRARSLPLIPIVVGVLLLATLTALASPGLEGSLVFGRGHIPGDPGPDGFVVSEDDPRPLWFLQIVMMWPAAYILATTGWQRWRGKHVPA
jgi:hypothetical protein